MFIRSSGTSAFKMKSKTEFILLPETIQRQFFFFFNGFEDIGYQAVNYIDFWEVAYKQGERCDYPRLLHRETVQTMVQGGEPR